MARAARADASLRRAARSSAGELGGDEYFDAYAEAAAGDGLNAYLWRAEPEPDATPGEGALAGVAVAVKDIFCTEGIADHGRLADPRGLPAALHGDRGAAARPTPARGCSARPTWTSSRWAPRTRTPAYGPVLNPWDTRAGPRRLLRRLGGRGRRPPRPLGDRHRHRRVDPPARVALRHRRPEADLRRDLPLRDDRLRLLARPVRAADPRRHRRRAAAAACWRAATPATRPRSGSRAGWSCPSREDLKGLRFGVPAGARARPRAIEAGVREVFERDAGDDRGARRRGRRDRASPRRARHLRLLRDRARRGLGEPRPLRRRPLRAARRRRRRPDRDVRDDPRRRASAPRSSGGSCSAPTRSPRATTTPTTAARSGSGPRSPRTSPAAFERLRLRRHPDLADRRLRARRARPTTRWRCTCPTTAPCRCRSPGIPAISIPGRPRGARRRRAASFRSASRSPRPPSREPRCSTPPTRSSGRSASTPGRGEPDGG